jgi:hypothetical protein
VAWIALNEREQIFNLHERNDTIMIMRSAESWLVMAAHSPKSSEHSIPPTASAAQVEPKLRPVLVKGSRKLPSKPRQGFAPEPAVIHDVRELLHLAGMVLAVAASRAPEDTELLHFLKLGERAIADVGTLMTAHFQI